MKSPFPGLDPYLQRYWGDVHHSFIQYTRDALQPGLPGDLRARVEERIYVEDPPGETRRAVPDVLISELSRPRRSDGGGTAVLKVGDEEAVAQPHVFQYPNPPFTEGFIEIRERGGGRVVTVIEFLSPANKVAGIGMRKYLEKQQEVVHSSANLVEIDLIRGGRYVLALPEERLDPEMRAKLMACITPPGRQRHELFIIWLRQRLPVLPIPLRPGDPAMRLDLQRLADQVYTAGRYDDLDYSRPPDPPLSMEEAAWMRELPQ